MLIKKYTVYIDGEPVPGFTDVSLERASSYVYQPQDVTKSTRLGVTVANEKGSASGLSEEVTINGPPYISSLILSPAQVGGEVDYPEVEATVIGSFDSNLYTLYVDGTPVDGYVGVELGELQEYTYTPLVAGKQVYVELTATNEYGSTTAVSNTVVASDPNSFVILIDTMLFEFEENTFSFGGGKSFRGQCDIYWGDGTFDLGYDGTFELDHEYSSPGQYEIRVANWADIGGGVRPGFGDKGKIAEIRQWGSTSWTSLESAFEGCTNIVGVATDTPNLGNCTSTSQMFAFSSFSQDINDWDVSAVTDMSLMFANFDEGGNKNPFNQPLNNWDVSNVINMAGMFFNSNFNQPIGNWDVSSVSNTFEELSGMYGMFAFSSFNQDISGWDVSGVVNMFGMFYDSPFNQDIGDWDVSSVQSMGLMFQQSAFNQDIGSWSLNANVDLQGMLDNCQMSSENYSRTLIGWANEASVDGTPFDISLGALGLLANSNNYGGSPYNNGLAARDFLIDSQAWGINDGLT